MKFKTVSLRFLLALPTGLALWGIQGYLLGYAHVRFLTLIYIIVFTVLFWREQKSKRFDDFKKIWVEIKKQPWWLFVLVAVSSFLQIFSHVGSGLMTATGLPFYFVNSVDGVMHLSYIQELVKNFPPQEPGAVGLPLINYHYWSDLVQAELIRVWQLPTIHVFFQYAPIVISTWTTVLFLRLISYLGGSRKTQLVALLLLTFGADAAYLITQVLHGHWGPNVSSLDSGVTFYFNIPQVYARFVFLASIFLLTKWWKERSFKTGVLVTLLIASLFGFKVYYALYAVFGFCFVVGLEIILHFISNLKKKSVVTALITTMQNSKFSLLLVGILAAISLAIYLPVNKAAGGLTYSFFEWPHLLLSAVNIDYIDWFLRMQVYKAYDNTRNIIIFNLWAAFLTFVAVYGTRMFGMLPLFKTKNEHMKKLFLFFIPTNILFVLLGLLTLQTSGGLNIFNFLIVPILAFNIFVAFNLSQLKTKIFVPFIVVFALLTIPRSLIQLNLFYERYSTSQADAVISPNELEAFTYLRNQEAATVQTSMENYYNYQTPYISFMSGQPTYIGGVSMLESHNQPTKERVAEIKEALTQSDSNLKADLLRSLGITYFIVPTSEYQKPNTWLVEKVFENETITIVKLQ
ncbi:MAG: hypothetical protein BroJett025_06340 [Patescibacteria group bacterium]|nr:MAG: hypothetical protein BroJett025_06340 [Patescibacteria group bacterium]